MIAAMSSSVIAKYVTPWKFRREQNEARVTALRHRDGDNCRRCKRPLRFEFKDGHDLNAKIEQIVPLAAGGSEALDNLPHPCPLQRQARLRHGRGQGAGAGQA